MDSESENRNQKRRPPTGGIDASVCLPCGLPLPVSVTDIARGDLKLLTDRPLRFGTRTNIVLHCQQLTNTAPNTGIVHWCRPASDGWELGLFLNAPIPESLVARTWWELRNSVRYECRWKAWIVEPDGEVRFPVLITDYSLGGIKFYCEERLIPGAPLNLSPSPHPDVPAYVVGQIERACVSENEYGCFLPQEGGRFLPGMFNTSQAIHMESPFVDGMRIRSSLLPEMIEKLPQGGFECDSQLSPSEPIC